MKITVDTKSFASAVDWATKNFKGKDDIPFVALYVSSDGTAHLTHVNQTSFMKAPFQVLDSTLDEGTDETSLALEGGFLQRLASALKGADGPLDLIMEEEGSETMTVKTTNGIFSIPLLDAVIPAEAPITDLGEVDEHEFFDALQRLSRLCDPANAGFFPVLGTVDVRLDAEEKKVVMMATDRYVLGEIIMDFTPEGGDDASAYMSDHEHLLLPVENSTMIAPSKDGSTFTLVHEGASDKFGYRFTDGRVALFSLKDEDPLPYLSLKERFTQNVENYASMNTLDLKKALDGISHLAFDETSIFLDFEGDDLQVGDAHRKNTMKVETETVEAEEDCSVGFLRTVISKAFAPISTKQLRLKWQDASSPFIFEALLDDGTVADNIFVFAIPQIKK